MGKKAKFFSLLAGDLVILVFSLWVTLKLRYGAEFSSELWRRHLLPFAVLFFFWVTVFYIAGLYDLKKAKRGLGYWAQILAVMFGNGVLAIVYFYLLSVPDIIFLRPFRVLAIELALGTGFLLIWRDVMRRVFASGAFAENLLLFGDTPLSRETAKYIQEHPSLGYRLVGILAEGSRAANPLPTTEIPDDLHTFVSEKKISTIACAIDFHKDPRLSRDLFSLLSSGIRIQDLTAFYEEFTGKVPVATIGEVWFLENIAEARKRLFEAAKRLFDLVVSMIGLALTATLTPFFALAIALDSRGPIFYWQDRVGKNGRIFHSVKFRSMFALTPDGSAELSGPVWAEPNDPRITSVGKFLRKTRLNELPQLWNVLKGEMSIIGPRPERPEFVRELEKTIPFYNERHLVKPGLTGWAQANFRYGASEEDALEKLQYDLFYIKHRSFVLEASILLKTIRVILLGKGW